MADASLTDDVFLRRASGLVKTAGAVDVYIYNLGLASVGIAVALAHFFVPANYFGASLPLSELIAGLFMAAMAFAFWCWSVVIPRSGGIYAFLSRGLHPAAGLALSFVDSCTWLFYNALAATYLTTIGIAPALFCIGFLTKQPWLQELAVKTQSPWFQFVLGTIAILLSGAVLVRGMRFFFAFQKILFILALTGTLAAVIVLLTANPHDYAQRLRDAYSALRARPIPALSQNWAKHLPLDGKMTMLAAVWPILSFVGSVFSVNIGGEVRQARKTQALGMFGSLFTAALLMALLSWLGDNLIGQELQAKIGQLPQTGPEGLPVVPYFSLLAGVAASHWLPALFVCLGFFAWAFFWLPATLVYSARTLLAWSFDRMAPASFGYVHPDWHTPVTALAVVTGANIFFLWLYLFVPFFATLTLVLAAMIAWVPTMFTAMVFPWRSKKIYGASALAGTRLLGMPIMTTAGGVGLIAAGIIAVLLWNDPVAAGHGWNSIGTIAGLFISGLVWYLYFVFVRRKQGIDVRKAFQEIPID